jgi:ABC-type uncharacterized transport system permease subunit
MQCACVILLSVVYPALWHVFPYYLTNGGDFRRKKFIEIKRVVWFRLQILSETFHSLRRTEWDMIKNVYIGLRVKYRLFLSGFNENWIFSTVLRKVLKCKNLMKIRPVGDELFYADGRTDVAKVMDSFHSFSKAPDKLVDLQ